MNSEAIQQIEADPFRERLRAAGGELTRGAMRVAKFIDENRATALASSAAEIAANLGTSDATVIRAVQALGFPNLGAMRQTLAASIDGRSTPADDLRRTLDEVGEGAESAIDLVLQTHRESLDFLQSKEAREAISSAVSRLHQADRIFVFGIGPSAPLARYVSILLARNGRRSQTLDATGIALADQLLDLRQRDAVLILAYGRPYREVTATFAEARRLRLPTVLVTDTPDSKMARSADVVIPARRGRAERVALHGATLVVLEAVVLGLAASNKVRAVDTLERLNDLREAVAGQRADVG